MSAALYAATLATALGCGLIAGAFFAFSSFVMGALGRLPAAQGIAAMQSINIIAVTPVFMTALFGTVDPRDAGAAARWEEFVRRWTAWNHHVRTVAALAATAAITLALHL